jgi:hypothetical protein
MISFSVGDKVEWKHPSKHEGNEGVGRLMYGVLYERWGLADGQWLVTRIEGGIVFVSNDGEEIDVSDESLGLLLLAPDGTEARVE